MVELDDFVKLLKEVKDQTESNIQAQEDIVYKKLHKIKKKSKEGSASDTDFFSKMFIELSEIKNRLIDDLIDTEKRIKKLFMHEDGDILF
jgi:isocitrate dehydrogenase kinase/phosphatase